MRLTNGRGVTVTVDADTAARLGPEWSEADDAQNTDNDKHTEGDKPATKPRARKA